MSGLFQFHQQAGIDLSMIVSQLVVHRLFVAS